MNELDEEISLTHLWSY